MLARTAADALVCIDDRDLGAIGSVDTLDGLHGTVTIAGRAIDALSGRKAPVFMPHRLANMDIGLHKGGNRLDRSSRAHMRALGAVDRAITSVERHLWLPKIFKPR